MFKKDYDIKKETNSIEEAREIKKHLEALNISYEMFAFGSFTEKEPQEGTPWDISHGKGQEIEKLGYSYAYVEYEEELHKIEPRNSDYSPGKIKFLLYNN